MESIKKCAFCEREIETPTPPGPVGYGTDADGNIVCYACCGVLDAQHMAQAGSIILYVTESGSSYRISNWPGTLTFTPTQVRHGRHNICGTRLDVWFDGPDRSRWHGVNIGDNQVLRCRRLAS